MTRQKVLFAEAQIETLPLAHLSSDGLYRYFLSRQWDSKRPAIAFIGLNPSTADAAQDDPTIRRCIAFAKAWGGGSLWMVNLFGFRSTKPEALRTIVDPIGPENDQWIDHAVQNASMVVAAWGNLGDLRGQANAISKRYQSRLSALSITMSGMPKHPLYVRNDVVPTPY